MVLCLICDIDAFQILFSAIAQDYKKIWKTTFTKGSKSIGGYPWIVGDQPKHDEIWSMTWLKQTQTFERIIFPIFKIFV